jgi:AcrR family transcriptional regulator
MFIGTLTGLVDFVNMNEHMSSTKYDATVTRKYDMTRRAAGVEETRRRIVEAAVELHQELGPARTTIRAIAERAGVQRLTVYRHFPDEVSILTACSAEWADRNPPPRSTDWNQIEDPEKRLRRALGAFYDYYSSEEKMIANSIRDAPMIPFVRRRRERFKGYLAEVEEELRKGWGVKGKTKQHLTTLVGHALRFETWHSFKQQGLGPSEAAELMTVAVTGIARRKVRKDR